MEIYIALYRLENTSRSDIEWILNLTTENCISQIVKYDVVGGYRHLLTSIVDTFNAQILGTRLAKKLNIELLLRLTGTKQIRDAVKISSPEEGSESLIVIACTDRSSIDKMCKLVQAEFGSRLSPISISELSRELREEWEKLVLTQVLKLEY